MRNISSSNSNVKNAVTKVGDKRLLHQSLNHSEQSTWRALPNVGYTGMCHRPGSIFHFRKSRADPDF